MPNHPKIASLELGRVIAMLAIIALPTVYHLLVPR